MTVRRLIASMVTLLGAAIVLAGCTSTAPPEPEPTTTPTATTDDHQVALAEVIKWLAAQEGIEVADPATIMVDSYDVLVVTASSAEVARETSEALADQLRERPGMVLRVLFQASFPVTGGHLDDSCQLRDPRRGRLDAGL